MALSHQPPSTFAKATADETRAVSKNVVLSHRHKKSSQNDVCRHTFLPSFFQKALIEPTQRGWRDSKVAPSHLFVEGCQFGADETAGEVDDGNLLIGAGVEEAGYELIEAFFGFFDSDLGLRSKINDDVAAVRGIFHSGKDSELDHFVGEERGSCGGQSGQCHNARKIAGQSKTHQHKVVVLLGGKQIGIPLPVIGKKLTTGYFEQTAHLFEPFKAPLCSCLTHYKKTLHCFVLDIKISSLT